MKNLIIITLFMCAAPSLQADWREEVNAIQREISALTANEQGLDDVTRLRRFYDLSYDLSMLENPVFATGLGDPRGQDRLTDLSQDGLARRRVATMSSL